MDHALLGILGKRATAINLALVSTFSPKKLKLLTFSTNNVLKGGFVHTWYSLGSE